MDPSPTPKVEPKGSSHATEPSERSSSSPVRPPRRTQVAFLCAILWGFFALLATIRVPIGALWLPTVASSAWGHVWTILGGAGAMLAVVAWQWQRPISRLGVATVLLLCGAALAAAAPLTRQRLAAGDLPSRLTETFGGKPPREAAGAPPRRSLIAPGAWFGSPAPEVHVETLEYARRGELPLLLDLYQRPATQVPRPLVVMVHGGSWQRGSRSDYPELNEYLAARGYAVADIDYRVAPAALFPAPIEDLHDALTFLVERAEVLGLDPQRIAVIGRSAGGHIALTAAYTSPVPVRGVVAFYAPTDMKWSWEQSTDLTYMDGKQLVEIFMGGPPSSDPELFRAASPLFLATETSPATLLFHGARDRLVAPEQSTRLARRLDELGVANLHFELPGATHGFDCAFTGPGAQISTFAIERFLGSVLGE